MRVTAGHGTLDVQTVRDHPTGDHAIRRIVTTAATSLAALALLGVPAHAGSSFAEAEVEADKDVTLTLTMTEPDKESYGDTATVTVTAPSSFTVISCTEELTWGCSADAENGRVTFTARDQGILGDRTLQFSVHTSPVNDTYAFTVVQSDGADEPMTATSKPAVTVTGGQQPSTDGDGTTGGDTTDDGTSDTSNDDSSDDGGTTGSGGGDSTGGGASSTDTSPDSTGDSDSSSADQDGASGGSGGTTPRRTEGRTTGTTLEITPGEPQADGPMLDAPAVADEPAVAPPAGDADATRDRDESPTAVAAGGQADGSPAGSQGLPWQQVLGAALLVAGGAVVAARRWDVVGRLRDGDVVARLLGWDPLTRIRRWRSG